MPRLINPYYSPADPSAVIGAGLGRALFGDPAMRLQQQQLLSQQAAREAAAEEAQAHARLYGTQAEGQDIQNGGARSLPEMIAAYAHSYDPPAPPPPPVPVAQPPMVDVHPGGAAPVVAVAPGAPVPAPAVAPDQIVVEGHRAPTLASHASPLAALLAAAAQAQGDKVNPSALAATVAAMLGDDESARRSMISMGHTPTKDFALTADRADDIASNAADATYKKDTAVAGINHSHDIPVANIHAGATVKSAEIGAGATVQSAGIHADASRDVARIGADAKANTAAKDGKTKPISAASMKMVDTEITNRGLNVGGDHGAIRPDTMMRLRKAAATEYQRTGNPVAAVDNAIKALTGAGSGKPAAPKGPPAGAPPGARQAPDGNFYVPDPRRPGKYLRVDG